MLTGQAAPKEWYHQFLEPNMDIKTLADDINKFFVSVTGHFSPIVYTSPQPVPEELYVTVDGFFRSLSSVNGSKAIGSDCLPNRLLKEFAYELPLIEDLYNQSLREGAFPFLLKSSTVTPVPKVNPTNHIESDLRPISLTCTLAKVLEGFTCSRLSQLDGKIDVRQYVRKGHSTTDVLLYML